MNSRNADTLFKKALLAFENSPKVREEVYAQRKATVDRKRRHLRKILQLVR